MCLKVTYLYAKETYILLRRKLRARCTNGMSKETYTYLKKKTRKHNRDLFLGGSLRARGARAN